jgi:ABC-type nitrate/sulfonate/bicarbonate transport system permease component
MKPKLTEKFANIAITFAGSMLLLVLWISLKFGFHIPDRYLPSPGAVYHAIGDLQPSFWYQCAVTATRLVIGSILGITIGIAIGILFSWRRTLCRFLLPSVLSMRAIPPVAAIPFFLLWFGFSETGKLVIIVFGIAFNIAVATLQAINSMPERYQILFKSFNIPEGALPISYSLPVALETLGPTVRFSVATAVGLVVVAELLGSQAGLGYLIQTSRSTFAMHTIFLATFGLAAIASVADWASQRLWRIIVFWKPSEKR